MSLLLIIPADENERETRKQTTVEPTLPELQTVVGGYVERLYVRYNDQDAHLFVNEDGRALALPLNGRASRMYGCDILGDVALWVGDFT